MRSRVRCLVGAVIACICCARSNNAHGQTRSLAESQLNQRLAQRISVTWQGQRLDAALGGLANSQRFAIWLDRRIDPSTPVELSSSEQTCGEILTMLSERLGCATANFHGVLYFGPPQTARELLTLSALARESMTAAAAQQRLRWLKGEAWEFPRLSEPGPLLRAMVESTGATLVGDELIPHDLWPARQLPTMSALDRAVLLLSGFDLTVQLSPDGRRAQVIQIARPVQLSRSYTVAANRIAAMKSTLVQAPEAKATWTGSRVAVLAPIEVHDQLARAMRGANAAPAKPSPATRKKGQGAEQRFTLKIENQPLGRVMDQLARQLNLQVKWAAPLLENPASGRDALVSCDVKHIDLDGLLKALTASANLAAERDGQRVLIKRP